MLGYGLAGSHRSGKTTLARSVANELRIPFLETHVSQVFKDLGLSPKQSLDFAQRMDVQDQILTHLEAQYEAMEDKIFIADRTPFDVLGYTMAEIQRDTLDVEGMRRWSAQQIRAVEITDKYFDGCLLLRPIYGAPEADTSAPANPVYMQHVFACIREVFESIGQTGLCKILVEPFVNPLEDRARILRDLIFQTFAKGIVWTPKN